MDVTPYPLPDTLACLLRVMNRRHTHGVMYACGLSRGERTLWGSALPVIANSRRPKVDAPDLRARKGSACPYRSQLGQRPPLCIACAHNPCWRDSVGHISHSLQRTPILSGQRWGTHIRRTFDQRQAPVALVVTVTSLAQGSPLHCHVMTNLASVMRLATLCSVCSR